MIIPRVVETVDEILDRKVAPIYKDQPLAQDWARVAKVIEELGETISELISYTGQNPRKPTIPEARERMLAELADTAMTAVYAIQHFTKDTGETQRILNYAQLMHESRLSNG